MEEEVLECLKFNYLYVCVCFFFLSLGEVEGILCRFLIVKVEVVEYIKCFELKWSFEY